MIDVYGYRIGDIVGKSGKIYNRDLTDGDFSISDLYIRTRSDTTAVVEAKIVINKAEYIADITTTGDKQLLTFLSNTPVTIFNVNRMEDYDTRNYIYTFILTTSDFETHSVHRNIIYTLNGDGGYNVLDIVSLANYILSGKINRG